MMLVAGFAYAQNNGPLELSRADRLAILYTPQLQFASSGEPLIKVGLAEGIDEIRFSASTAISLMPLGEGGAVIEVPAGVSLVARASEGQPGTYLYSVIVATFAPDERRQVVQTRALWEARGMPAQLRQVGAIFAIAGQRFDTRKTLITVGETRDRAQAEALVEELALEHGLDARLHTDLEDYPGALISISGLPGGVVVHHQDVFWVKGEPSTVFTIQDVPYDRWMGGSQSETRRYTGALVFSADWEGRLSVINEITLERLVEGILPSEIYADSPREAMRAQAVAARSEVLADLGVRHIASPYMTCSDQRCQMYRGIGVERRNESQAVRDTRGEILSFGDQVIKAYYSSNNGGFAGSNATTWGEEQRPYLLARPDGPNPAAHHLDGLSESEVADFIDNPPDSYAEIPRAASTFRWTRSLTGSQLDQAIGRRYPEVGQVRDLRVLERDASGRVIRLEVQGSRSTVVVERELNVRMALGVDRPLPSALMIPEVGRNPGGGIATVSIRGGGFGHGVGMCQSGSVGMANRGSGYREILSNYYPGTTLRTLY